jgi:hypothetical protein
LCPNRYLYYIYTRVLPLTYSVIARAIKPNIAILPFHSSALEDMIPFDLDSTLTPSNNGTKEATDNKTLVYKNHGIPPPDIWSNKPCPFANSTPIAVTKPIIANLPLILSGAGPLKAIKSENFVLIFVVGGVIGCPFFGSSAMDLTLRLTFLLEQGMYIEGMLLNWLTLDILEMLLMELDMIDW